MMKTLSVWFTSVVNILLLACCLAVSVQADVNLHGYIHVGDNWLLSSDPIEPKYLVRDSNGFKPVKAINFSLSEQIDLTRIIINDDPNSDSGINHRLYFMLWDSNENLRVEEWSNATDYDRTDVLSITLPAGDYKIAIVGQCKILADSKGWRLPCGLLQDYDDFSYDNITLVSAEENDHVSFIQRRHIGNNTEFLPFSSGYAGKFYPDAPDGKAVNESFDILMPTEIKTIVINNYRDLDSGNNGKTIRLTLRQNSWPNNEFTTWMNANNNSTQNPINGIDVFTWKIDKILSAGHYTLKIESVDTGWILSDYDDISWDDIVIKLKPDTTSGINHFRLQHDNTALTCDGSDVVIQACSNTFVNGETCVEATSRASVNLTAESLTSGATVFDEAYDFIGSTTAELSYQNAETLTLSLAGVGSKAVYCNNNEDNNCNITFADAGFVFSYDNNDGSTDIASQTAGINFKKPIKLTAFYNQRGQCKDIYTNNQSVAVNLGIQCQSPGICTDRNFIAKDTIIGKNASNESVNTTPVSLFFNSNITTINPAVYEDAGQINIIARHTINRTELDCTEVNCSLLDGLTLTGQSNPFWVKPDHFIINAIGADGEILNNTSSTGVATYSAAKPFTLKVSAVNAQKAVTRNYQPADITNVVGELTRVIPAADGRDGIFKYASGPSEPASINMTLLSGLTPFGRHNAGSGGISLFQNALYDDAGTLKLNITDKHYPGGEIQSLNGGTYLGGFIPERFELLPDDSGVTNYVTDNDDRSNDFTYLGQDALVFDYKVKAVNFLGKITANYPLSTSTHSVRFFAENRPLDINGDVIAEPLQEILGFVDAGTWRYGVYTGSTAAQLTRPDDTCLDALNNTCGPYNKAYFGMQMVDDNDPIALIGHDMYMDGTTGIDIATTISQTSSRQLYGRWTIGDGYGPINQAFPVVMALEYYNGNTFVLNPDDSRTSFSASHALATFEGTNIGLTGSGLFQAGVTSGLIIDTHDNEGDVLLNHTVPQWLKYDWLQTGASAQDPSAIISFGFYRGTNNVIYRRQVN